MWTGCIWVRIRTNSGCCEHGIESVGSIKDGEFFQ
jgi:hypothetical protein